VRRGAVAAAALLLMGAAPASPPTHLGVASCAGGNCHFEEYRIWWQETDPTRIDRHHLAYKSLFGEEAGRIARNLGIADAAQAPLCLDCHADDVPLERRGPLFQLSDGVGCEACHGGASNWLGVHLEARGHEANLAAGLYPTEDPAARAKLCLGCHFGDPSDDRRFVTHRLLGAGHPRLPFELDTFTLAEPAHFTPTPAYVARKGPVSDTRIWAVGQAAALALRTQALTEPRRAPEGLYPELALFDCQACHHDLERLQWQERPATGLGPGRVVLDDANAVMLEVIAARAAPELAPALRAQLLELHRATTKDWGAVSREAAALRSLAEGLETTLARRPFTAADLAAFAAALTGGTAAATFPIAEQATMALGALASDMQRLGALPPAQIATLNTALAGLGETVADEGAWHPAPFLKALQDAQRALPQQ
jgi:hypothetical protein